MTAEYRQSCLLTREVTRARNSNINRHPGGGVVTSRDSQIHSAGPSISKPLIHVPSPIEVRHLPSLPDDKVTFGTGRQMDTFLTIFLAHDPLILLTHTQAPPPPLLTWQRSLRLNKVFNPIPFRTSVCSESEVVYKHPKTSNTRSSSAVNIDNEVINYFN